MRFRAPLLTLFALSIAATSCGEDAAGPAAPDASADAFPDASGEIADEEPATACLSAEGLTPPFLSGRIYEDGDESDRSLYDQSFEPPTDVGLSGIEVSLLGPELEQKGLTCPEGDFAFGELDDGVYLLDLGLDDDDTTTTKNQSYRLPDAIRSGSVTLVTFGDSLPVFGDEPYYPARLAELLGQLATVENINVAVGGTTSEDWLPGTSLFDSRLAPELPDADVVLISLGGNDALYYMQDSINYPGGVMEAIRDFGDFMLEVLDRLLTIIEAIRAINPDADIVYGLYPNYAESDRWSQMLGPLTDLVSETLSEALEQVRDELDPAERIILVDLYGAMADRDIDEYLYDELHLNDAGHAFYAEAILEALGGGRIGPSPIGLVHNVGMSGAQP